ncbi:hypothetical protein PENNAL_c0098G10884, partial [Penicillium nalgiovense]
LCFSEYSWNTQILVPSTTKRCLHGLEALVVAAIPCKARLLTQNSSCEAHFYARGAQGSEGAQFLHRWARGSDSRGHGSSEIFVFAAPPLRSILFTQTHCGYQGRRNSREVRPRSVLSLVFL